MASEASAAATSIPELGSASQKPPIDSAAEGGNDSNAATKGGQTPVATATAVSPAAETVEPTKSEALDATKDPIKPSETEEAGKQAPVATVDSTSVPAFGITSAIADAAPAAPAQLPVPGTVVAPLSATEPATAATNGIASAEAAEIKNDDAKTGDKRSAEEPAAEENSDEPDSKAKDAVKKVAKPAAKKMKTDDKNEKAEPESGINGVKRGKSKYEKKSAAPVGRTERKTRSQGLL